MMTRRLGVLDWWSIGTRGCSLLESFMKGQPLMVVVFQATISDAGAVQMSSVKQELRREPNKRPRRNEALAHSTFNGDRGDAVGIKRRIALRSYAYAKSWCLKSTRVV